MSKVIELWNKHIKGEKISEEELITTPSITFSTPPSSPWTTTSSTSGGIWSSGGGGGMTSSGYFTFGGGYGWGELEGIPLDQLSFAIGHTIVIGQHYDTMSGISLRCEDCGLASRHPWGDTYGDRVMTIGRCMLDMLRLHANRDDAG